MNQLEQLILFARSLDKSEKRYFRLLQRSIGKADSQPEQLFDWALSESAQPFPSQQELGPLFQNLPTLIRRLQQAMLDSLVHQHSGKTIESKLNQSLEGLNLLFRKKHWEQVLWQLKKAKRLALEYSYLPQFLSLISLEQKVILNQFPKGAIDAIERLRQEEIRVLSLLGQQSELKHLDLKVRHLIRQRLHSHASRKQLLAIVEMQVVQDGLHSPDFLSFSYASNIIGNYLNAEREYQKAIGIYQNVFTGWQQQITWIRERPHFFLSLFSNYQVALLYGQKDTQVLEEALRFVREIKLRDPAMQLIFQSASYQFSMVVFMNQGDFDAAAALSLKIRDWIALNAQNLSANVTLTFLYNGAVTHFMREDFAEAQRNVYRIIAMPPGEARSDIREFARIFQVVIAYETGDAEHAEYLLNACYQHFLRTEYPPLFRILVRYLRKILKVASPHSLEETQQAFLQALLDLRAENSQKPPFGLTELEIWVRAKIRGIPLRESFRRVAAGEEA